MAGKVDTNVVGQGAVLVGNGKVGKDLARGSEVGSGGNVDVVEVVSDTHRQKGGRTREGKDFNFTFFFILVTYSTPVKDHSGRYLMRGNR